MTEKTLQLGITSLVVILLALGGVARSNVAQEVLAGAHTAYGIVSDHEVVSGLYSDTTVTRP